MVTPKQTLLEIPFLELEGTSALHLPNVENDPKSDPKSARSERNICTYQKKVVPLQPNMISTIIHSTADFISAAPKQDRKKYGQFFTSEQSARQMAQMFTFDLNKPIISILDAGAGTGLLSAAVLSRLKDLQYNGQIHLVCYETDPKVLPVLERNLENISHKIEFTYNIVNENYITSQQFEHQSSHQQVFDYIIGNPPYLKLSKDAAEVQAMPQVCYGAPNLYFLFWAMGIYNLKESGELVYIIPRSWTSGAYFAKFRQYLFSHCVITNIHSFVSRKKVFNQEDVLQETMIIKVKKTTIKPELIHMSSSSCADFRDIRHFDVPYHTVVAPNQYVYLVTNQEESTILERINKLPETLPNVDLQMKTGIVVDFRAQDVLRNENENGAYPIFYSSHIKNGRVQWPVGRQGEYIVTDRRGYLQPNVNYLFVKRFTSKEEKRRLQCGMYRQKDYPQYKYISTQNKINYITCQSLCTLYGMYALLSSTLYDQYYRILNGSTQVNSTEINTIPVPNRATIEAIGRDIMQLPITEANCDKIINKWIN